MNRFIFSAAGLAFGAALSFIAVNAQMMSSSGTDSDQTYDQFPAITKAEGNELTQAELIAATMLDICTSEDVHGSGTGTADEGSEHTHPILNVKADVPQPTITHLIYPDKKDGYNIQILTQNFSFTPARINGDVKDNEGHAHLYLNGEKIARLYSHWYHIPSSMLATGMNYMTVTLNANDHSEWAINNVPISSTVRVVKPDTRSY